MSGTHPWIIQPGISDHRGGKKTAIVFSGDIGRYDQPILKDPATPPSKADVLICESTYGDREHPDGDPRNRWRKS